MGIRGLQGGAWLVLAAAGGGVPAARRWDAAAAAAGGGNGGDGAAFAAVAGALSSGSDRGAEMTKAALNSTKAPSPSLSSAGGVSCSPPSSRSVAHHKSSDDEELYLLARGLIPGKKEQLFPSKAARNTVSNIMQALVQRRDFHKEPKRNPSCGAGEQENFLVALIPEALITEFYPRDAGHPFFASLWLSLAQADARTRGAALEWARAVGSDADGREPVNRVDRILEHLKNLNQELAVSNSQAAGFRACVLLSALWDASLEQCKRLFAWGDAKWQADSQWLPSVFNCLLLTEPVCRSFMREGFWAVSDLITKHADSSRFAHTVFLRCILPRVMFDAFSSNGSEGNFYFFALTAAVQKTLSALRRNSAVENASAEPKSRSASTSSAPEEEFVLTLPEAAAAFWETFSLFEELDADAKSNMRAELLTGLFAELSPKERLQS